VAVSEYSKKALSDSTAYSRDRVDIESPFLWAGGTAFGWIRFAQWQDTPSEDDRLAGHLLKPGRRFDSARCCPQTDCMDVHLSTELQAKLDRLAAQQGRDTEWRVHETLERWVDYDEWFIREVEKGLAQVERGELLVHEEVGARIEKRITEKQRRV